MSEKIMGLAEKLETGSSFPLPIHEVNLSASSGTIVTCCVNHHLRQKPSSAQQNTHLPYCHKDPCITITLSSRVAYLSIFPKYFSSLMQRKRKKCSYQINPKLSRAHGCYSTENGCHSIQHAWDIATVFSGESDFCPSLPKGTSPTIGLLDSAAALVPPQKSPMSGCKSNTGLRIRWS